MHVYTTNTGECDLSFHPYDEESMSYVANEMYDSRKLSTEQSFLGDTIISSYTEAGSKDVASVDQLFENYNQQHPFCVEDLKIGYGVVSSILLGSFNPGLFIGSHFMFYVFILFSFCAAIFLITLLITLVNEYYEKLKGKRVEMFAVK